MIFGSSGEHVLWHVEKFYYEEDYICNIFENVFISLLIYCTYCRMLIHGLDSSQLLAPLFPLECNDYTYTDEKVGEELRKQPKEKVSEHSGNNCKLTLHKLCAPMAERMQVEWQAPPLEGARQWSPPWEISPTVEYFSVTFCFSNHGHTVCYD